MSKVLPLFCLIVLMSIVAATSEAGIGSNPPPGSNAGDEKDSAADGSVSLAAPLWLSASALALPPPYPLYAPPGTLIVQEPTYTRVGEIVQKIPTAISHQSQTVVHNHADLVTPIVAPAIRTQVLRTYNGPYIYASSYLAAAQPSLQARK